MDFKELGVDERLKLHMEKHGIVVPTIVQVKVIPLIFEGKDVLVQSETGSGKTIGFAIPTIEMVAHKAGVQVLVITPTRELAKQVSEEYVKFSKDKGLGVAVVYGGVSMDKQTRDVRSAEVVVGTPGRLLDLLNRYMLDLTKVRYLVIDEADRLLDMGFIDDINRIVRFIPENRQTMMFSATINSRVLGLADRYTRNPSKILLENVLEKGILKQYYYDVKEYDKLSLLLHLLKTEKIGLALVFCNTKRKTFTVAKILKKYGVRAECLNGDMTQFMREKVMTEFATGNIDVLVATDVAARGIHVDDITHVINYDLHDEADTYTHRIGRTARNGKKGTAITLLSDNDYWKMEKVMDTYREMIEKREAGEFEKIAMERPRYSGQRYPRSRYSGQRSSGPRYSGRGSSRSGYSGQRSSGPRRPGGRRGRGY